ncbi:MAG: mandelate racemase/muconate lactonizing enzyme family protein [Candidatus Latescibacteria bacterium]|nr:mandelate racemase/muconate lactonizing enzyme family protein [Candidatus Latescibacterota bacterium]
MKIKSIRAFPIDVTPAQQTPPRVPQLPGDSSFVHPMRRYPEFSKGQTTPGRGNWTRTACVVTAEDGTWGFGLTQFSGPVTSLINDHLALMLEGQNCMAIEKIWDIMQRSTSCFGTAGLVSYAISAVDNALWDVKGKILERPVYELLGGPQKERITCYASCTDMSYGVENSIEWFLELGFRAVKLFMPHGPEDDLDGLRRNEEMVARTREQVGDSVEIAVDTWLSMNVEYAVRLAEALKPYRIKWLEDPFLPDDLGSYSRLRQRVPHMTMATGEHWYSLQPFAHARANGLVDILQPDPQWVGGVTAVMKICHLAQAHGVSVIAHAGMNYAYGQHLSLAMPAIVWGERSEGVSPPGVPLEERIVLPGTPAIKDGYLVPSDGPGFGFDFTLAWLEERST